MKKIILLTLFVSAALFTTAQNVGIGTTSPVARLHVSDSNVLFTGPATVPPSTAFYPPAQGAGTRMFWYPQKGSFRAGAVDNTQWDKDSIGRFSFATGFNSKAKGENSFAAGAYSNAAGENSLALGYFTSAPGDRSSAMGYGSTSPGFGSTVLGFGSIAAGNYATSIGLNTVANGGASISMGDNAVANGNNSFSLGHYTNSKSDFSFVTGKYNDTTAVNSLFEIGNGTANNLRSNAVTVLQNGNVGINTTAPVARLHVADSNVVFTSTSASAYTPYSPPVEGFGIRMMWYPQKGAFRTGFVNGTQWDKDSIGRFSFSAGANTKAKGEVSISMGTGASATGNTAVAIGYGSSASATTALATGYYTTASGDVSTALGWYTSASGAGSVSLGYTSSASADVATAMGWGSSASGAASTAMGYFTKATSDYSTAIGLRSLASGGASTAIGDSAVAAGNRAFSAGYYTKANGSFSVAMGAGTKAFGQYSFAMGGNTAATGNHSVAMGVNTTASGPASVALGDSSVASGYRASSFGSFTTASGEGSTAIGGGTKAQGVVATAMGNLTEAQGMVATAMGYGSVAQGGWSLAAGYRSHTVADHSYAMGQYVKARSVGEFAIGAYNDTSATNRLFEIGNGTDNTARKNALTMLVNGNMGMGTNNPTARLHITDSSVLFTAPNVLPGTPGSTPVSGAGNRMMWYADKASFRAGNVVNDSWDKDKIGNVSFAVGSSTQASGITSFAAGNFSYALGDASTAMGFSVQAKAKGAAAFGIYNDITDNPNPSTEASTDRLFQVGNGASNVTRTNAMTVLRNGNVGIGNNNPYRPLSFPPSLGEKILLYPGGGGEVGIGVYGNELRLHCDNPGSKVSLGTQDNAGVFTEQAKAERNGAYAFYVFGNLWANGTTYPSDERYKKNVTSIESPLQRLLQLNGVEYEMKREEYPQYYFQPGKQMGLMAQNVEKIVPEAVSETNGYKGVDYARLVPLLIESIKEQQKQIDELRQQLAASRKGQ